MHSCAHSQTESHLVSPQQTRYRRLHHPRWCLRVGQGPESVVWGAINSCCTRDLGSATSHGITWDHMVNRLGVGQLGAVMAYALGAVMAYALGAVMAYALGAVMAYALGVVMGVGTL